jgi:hypothetical protein
MFLLGTYFGFWLLKKLIILGITESRNAEENIDKLSSVLDSARELIRERENL